MMRWLAAALLLTNLAYFWYAGSPAKQATVAPVAVLGARQLVLLSEQPAPVGQSSLPGEAIDAPAEQSRTAIDAAEESGTDENALPQAPRQCWELGPLDATMQADLASLFERASLPMRSFEREEVDAASYRVYLAIREPSQIAGFERQLKAAGVESYVIGGGELEGDLSLGLFTSRERAEAVAAPLQELKLPVVIHTRQRLQNRSWLRVDSREVAALGWSADLADLTLWPRPGILSVPCYQAGAEKSH